VAFASAALAGDDEVIATTDEVESTELDEEGLLDTGLEVPVEGFEGFALEETTGLDAVGDAAFALVVDLDSENVLEQSGVSWTVVGGPVEQLVELGDGLV